MKIEGDQVTFSTGKQVYVKVADPQSPRYLTRLEQVELADYMLDQWRAFKRRALALPT
jgi:hypothetical protein